MVKDVVSQKRRKKPHGEKCPLIRGWFFLHIYIIVIKRGIVFDHHVFDHEDSAARHF